MIRKTYSVFVTLGALLICALCSSASAKITKLPSAIANHTFACDGTETAEGTGTEKTEVPSTLTIHFGRDIGSINTPELFCTTDRKCQVHISDTAIKLTVRVPITATEDLSFDWQSGTIDYGSGGLDGGRNFHGHCSLEKETLR